ncbi:aldo/keto reductase [Joostella sp.]|uniref:aldo/keto reductase n=1 Tax=Joostella sp. TaxID=2231138 RepID=UPI003A8FCB4F
MAGAKTIIGIGLAALGRPEYINVKQTAVSNKSEETFKKNAFKVLDDAYEQGVRYYDTAPSYGKGEKYLHEWNDTRNHQGVFLGTKWGYTYVADWELGYDGKHEIKEHSLAKLLEQWEVSKNLLPNLKYYQIHSATLESGVLENKEVLEKLAEIKSEYGLKIGLTSSGENQKTIIQKGLDVVVNGEELFDSFQVTYNILENSTNAILKSALANGKTVIIKEALANGRVFENENYPAYKSMYALLEKLAAKYNIGTDAVALRFCMDALAPSIVLSGASSSSQLEANLKAYNFKLTEEEITQLNELSVESDFYWKERSELNWH